MDEIIIEDIEVFAHHGVFDFEKINGQNFYISARLMVDELTKSDNLDETIDYGKVTDMIVENVSYTKFDLIESVAHSIASLLLRTFDILRSVEITIKKPSAPIAHKFGNVMVVVRESKHIAYLGIGSNMGDKRAYLDMARDMLDKDESTRVLKVSDYIVTKPYGVLDQDDFLNGAIKIETTRSPRELLELCHSIESAAGRVRTRRWGERTLDVDILLYDDLVMNEDDLVIPHLEMHMRDFVLRPLCEIGAGAVHPVLNKTVYTLLKELEA